MLLELEQVAVVQPPLTPQETAFFLENRRNMHVLMQSGFFGLRGGSVELHFDGDGAIRKVEAHHTLFYRK